MTLDMGQKQRELSWWKCMRSRCAVLVLLAMLTPLSGLAQPGLPASKATVSTAEAGSKGTSPEIVRPADPVQTIMEQWIKSGQIKPRGPKRPIPRELTDEQRAMLSESPELFPYIEVEGIHPGFLHGHPYWMDEVRLIMAVDRYGDWRAGPGELPKIVIFHTDTRKFEETPYRGALECFTPERMVVMESRKGWRSRGNVASDKTNPYPVLAGRFGEPLKAEAYAGYETSFNKFTCRAFNPKNDPPANKNYWMHPLREGDGAIGSRAPITIGSDPAMVKLPALVLFDAEGKVYAERMLGTAWSFEEWIFFNTTTRRYFYSFSGDQCGDTSKGSATPGERISFRVGKGWQETPTPALLVNMLDWCFPATYGSADTAAGIVYWPKSVYDARRYAPDYNRGLYIQVDNKMHRFFKAHAEVKAISPSGCRVFAPYKADTYDPSPAGDVPKARIFNVCQGDKK